MVGGAAATAAALTVGVAAPANAAAVTSGPASTTANIPVAQSAVRLGEGVAESGERFVKGAVAQPVNAVTLATAIAQGNDELRDYLVQQLIDAPLWIADPTLEALKDIPATSQLGEELWQRAFELRQLVRQVVLGSPETLPSPGSQQVMLARDVAQADAPDLGQAIDAFVALSKGLSESGLNAVKGTVLGPVSVVLLAVAITQGDEDQAKYVAQQIIDEPLWVAKPTLDALQTLPAPVGGPGGFGEDSFLRAYEVRQAVRSVVLGSDETLPNPDNSGSKATLSRGITPDAVSLSSVDPEGTSNLPDVPTPPARITKKGPLLNVIRGVENSPVGTQRGTTVNGTQKNAQNQLRTAAENAQSQLNTATTNTVKRVTDAIGNIGKHRDSENSSPAGASGKS